MGIGPDTGTEKSECGGEDDGIGTSDKGFNGGWQTALGFVGARKTMHWRSHEIFCSGVSAEPSVFAVAAGPLNTMLMLRLISIELVGSDCANCRHEGRSLRATLQSSLFRFH
jgi:hypothetical protein